MTALNFIEYYNEKHKAGFTDSQIAEQLGLNVNFLKDFLKGINDDTIQLDTSFEIVRSRKIPVISIDYVNQTATGFSKEFMDWLNKTVAWWVPNLSDETAMELISSRFTCKCLLADGSELDFHYHDLDADHDLPDYKFYNGVHFEEAEVSDNSAKVDIILRAPTFTPRRAGYFVESTIMHTTLTFATDESEETIVPTIGEICIEPSNSMDGLPNPLIKSVEVYFDVDQI
jgi:hypothetical protein